MKNYSVILVGLVLLLLLSTALSVCIGAVNIKPGQLLSLLAYRLYLSDDINFTGQQEAVLFSLRLPRVVLGLLVGSSLAISGAVMQGLFRNPLAEPGLIGISSGASLFAVLIIVLNVKFLTTAFGYHALAITSFFGACITTFLVYSVANGDGNTNIATLLLVGIAINALAGSITGLLTYMSNDEQLRNITFWSLGSLGGATWKTVTSILPFVIPPLTALPLVYKQLNALALGESQARHMGVNVNMLKKLIIILATLGVGASVAVSGIIGFVGLVVPHILRMAFAADNRLVIVGSALLGASVLVLADLFSRTLVAPAELPIGILTAMIGTPIFIYIVLRERKKRSWT